MIIIIKILIKNQLKVVITKILTELIITKPIQLDHIWLVIGRSQDHDITYTSTILFISYDIKCGFFCSQDFWLLHFIYW